MYGSVTCALQTSHEPSKTWQKGPSQGLQFLGHKSSWNRVQGAPHCHPDYYGSSTAFHVSVNPWWSNSCFLKNSTTKCNLREDRGLTGLVTWYSNNLYGLACHKSCLNTILLLKAGWSVTLGSLGLLWKWPEQTTSEWTKALPAEGTCLRLARLRRAVKNMVVL